tara:strand:- start:4797 stop:5093 length:297 start_codon:yes stop_codon:yes gene_type:complete
MNKQLNDLANKIHELGRKTEGWRKHQLHKAGDIIKQAIIEINKEELCCSRCLKGVNEPKPSTETKNPSKAQIYWENNCYICLECININNNKSIEYLIQ